ncbi:MAG: hypothetical protein JO257_35425 [Deltaproteobacteria bacterium]|nr:hypothetical protein [Deltaproteobacteria bacterium]
MRSWPSLLLVVAACGVGPAPNGSSQQIDPDTCAKTSYLDYTSFGEPFLENWCRGCHSSQLPPAMRQMAPANVNFDSLDDVHHWATVITTRAAGSAASMPPAGGPSDDERQMLVDWLGCGAK